jgi:hypothetical protein
LTGTQFADRRASAARTRLSRAVFLAVFAVGAVLILRTQWPRTHEVDVLLPDRDGGISALHVEFARGEDVLRAFDRRFEDPAPQRVRFGVELADGAYDVLVRTEARAGPVLERTVPLTLSGDAVRRIRAR